jgi:myosin protein heavy chain
LNDAEADRALLQKARRALQGELETIKLDHVDTNKMSSDRELQKLQLRKQDLERSLEEQEDRVANAFDRMQRAESYANECQIELGKVRVDNSELDRLNVSSIFFGNFVPALNYYSGTPRKSSQRAQRSDR